MQNREDTGADFALPFPHVLRIEPASQCNLACSHCPTGTVEMTRGIMEPETFARIREEVKRHRPPVDVIVLYHGGEPFVTRFFPQMLAELKALDIPFIKAVSNGMLLREDLCRTLIEQRLDAIEISLDATSLAESDRIRRGAAGAEILANIKRFLDLKRALGATSPRVFVANTQFLDPSKPFDVNPEPETPRYLKEAFEGPYAEEVQFKCTYALEWPHMVVLPDMYEVYSDPRDTETRNVCDNVESTMTIRWNGDVVACCYDLTSRCILGNVLEQSLDAIWNGEPFRRLRRSIATKRFTPLCAGCAVVNPKRYLVLKAPHHRPQT